MVSVPPSGSRTGERPGLAQSGPVIAPLTADAQQLAVLLDFDGTLAPIVDDPQAARPTPQAADAVTALAARAALVACVTGRPALVARELLGVPGIAYSGLHGAERLAADAAAPQTPAAFAADADQIAALVEAASAEPAGLAGLDVERKGPIVALHWRRAADPAAAEARARELGERAQAAGLRAGEGRSVLELRPALEITKGDAVRGLLADAGNPRRVLFAGDDVTDLDAFAALSELAEGGALDALVLVAVAGVDAPPQVAAAADVTVASPAELGSLLADVAAALGGAPASDQRSVR